MATTNKTIIEAYKTAHDIPLTAPLYTWGVWRNLGYQVKKGEKCRHRVALYKHTTKKIEQDGQERTVGRCFVKTANLFTSEQVEKIAAS